MKKTRNSKYRKILNILKQYHTGLDSPVTGKELGTTLGVTSKAVQKLIRELRFQGQPICSSNTGYYYAETRQDIADTANRFSQHIASMIHTQQSLLQSTPDEKEKIVVVLPDEGLKVSLNIKSMKKG